jgi:L-ribulose-5-phosphate 3-epimerase
MNRRDFLKVSLGSLGSLSYAPGMAAPRRSPQMPLFQISLAEWSFHRALRSGSMDHLDFAAKARRSFGLDGIEYVNQFFFERARDQDYLREMKSRADSEGVRSLLIMCDREGALGAPDDEERARSVSNHEKWLDAAAYLGCHSIRVNAQSSPELSEDEQGNLAADGLRKLCELADPLGLNVLVENHGGTSSKGAWLASVMKRVAHPRIGTLPDFGNFRIRDEPEEWYDRYQGVRELMPFAKAVSAKSYDFDAQGRETKTDFHAMLRIVLDAGYHGFLGIEYEGDGLDEETGVQKTKDLLVRVREELA